MQDTPPPAIDTWRGLKFGLFVHWGPVSLKGTEIGWSRGGLRRDRDGVGQIPAEEYDGLYTRFNPVRFDAREWAATARDAGMRYVVFTTKHHDGFCMWDTQQSDYKITRSPFGRDVCAELAAAFREAGLKVGWYYSCPDWHHPDFFTARHHRYLNYMKAQVRELLTGYGPIDIMWFDADGGANTPATYDADAVVDLVRTLAPGAVINRRCGGVGDIETPEQQVGRHTSIPWESCITLCRQWSWKPDDTMKSAEECVHTLLRCAGGDGNLLFNVGPMPTGEIEPRQVQRLHEIGQSIVPLGESLYGARGGPYQYRTDTASLHRGRHVFVHVLEWRDPGDAIVLENLPRRVESARVFNGPPLAFEQSETGIRVMVPPALRRPIVTTLHLHLDGPC
jgi:alpha-L-fucosidase